MNRLIVSLLFVLILASGCGSPKLDISLEKAPEYQHGVPTEMIVKVTEGGQHTEGLSIVAILEMAKMDHGVIEVPFEHIGEGLYSGQVELPMAGEWIADVKVESAGKQVEEVLTFEVKAR